MSKNVSLVVVDAKIEGPVCLLTADKLVKNVCLQMNE